MVSAHASLSHPSRHFGARDWCVSVTSYTVVAAATCSALGLSVSLESVSQSAVVGWEA